jgi:hypothetical protein
VDSAGTTTSVTTYTSGRIDEIQRAVTDGGTTTTYSLVYSYLSSGANSGRLERVTVRKKVGAGSWTELRRVSYAYFGSGEANGNLGDLKTATVEEPDGSGGWNDVAVSAYRYYTSVSVSGITRSSSTATATVNSHGLANGDPVTIAGATQSEYNGTFTVSNVTTNTFDYTVTGTPATPATGTITAVLKGYERGLKYVLRPEAYRRIKVASLDPLTATNAEVADYADSYFEYGSGRKVSRVVDHAHCGSWTPTRTGAAASAGPTAHGIRGPRAPCPTAARRSSTRTDSTRSCSASWRMRRAPTSGGTITRSTAMVCWPARPTPRRSPA